MDLTNYIPRVPRLLDDVDDILGASTIVMCFGHLKWLGGFMCIPPITKRLTGAATTEDEGFIRVEQSRPDLLISSQFLEAGSGLSLLKQAKATNRRIKTILVVENDDILTAEEALRLGCDGICRMTDNLTYAIRVVMGGGVYYSGKVKGTTWSESDEEHIGAINGLDEIELEALRGMMLGLPKATVAARLGISFDALTTTEAQVLAKLGATTQTQALRKAMQAGILTMASAITGRMKDEDGYSIAARTNGSRGLA
ncbi:response regulator transcription factor [Synechococcus sp. RSCCF101]|uniref:helix-turn-helix transcriptional regulator n=1 Tax=Synechococcus sp. RSCCF101 TaxID=2511069 RepID=UPI001246D383|nr:response regulator transcription factor [Synechococcus sp. RSCCF101]QEY33032.1 response regulator transcription factor [Synechococcus sp. RSCCF101]